MRGKAFARGNPTCPPLALDIKTDLIRLGGIYALEPHVARSNSDSVPVNHSRRSSKVLGFTLRRQPCDYGGGNDGDYG